MGPTRKFVNCVLLFLCVLPVVFVPVPALTYGGGGGGGGEDTDTTGINSIHPLTREEIREVFSTITTGQGETPGFDDATVSFLSYLLEGQEMTTRDLMGIRQTMLELDSTGATIQRYEAQVNLVLVQSADAAGEVSRFFLAFVPGVGWGTTAALSTARSGADEIKKGGDAWDVSGAMTIDALANLITKGIGDKVSVLNFGNWGDKALVKGAERITLARNAINQTVKKHLIKRGKKSLLAGFILKSMNKESGNLTKEGLQKVASAFKNEKKRAQVPNTASPPTVKTIIRVPEHGPKGGPASLPAAEQTR